MNGLLSLNCRTLGVSRDQLIAAALHIGGGWMLIQDDPALVIQAKAAGLRTIYRQSGDETLATPPDVFVQTRAEKGADYVYLTNELDPTPELLDWTRRAIDYATAIRQKLCIFNFSTDRQPSQWAVAHDVAAYAVARGHAIGCHVYQRSGQRGDSYHWLDLKHSIGGLWLVTEYAFYVDAYHGYRGVLSPQQYGAFFDATLPLFRDERMPVFCFSAECWPANDQGKASGFGVADNSAVLDEMARVNQKYVWTGVPPVTQPPQIQVPADPGAPVPSTVIESGVRFRAAPSLAAPELRKLALNERVAAYPATRTNVSGYPFEFMETASGEGWASVANLNGDWWIKPDDQPTFRLHPPFMPYLIVSAFNAPRPGYATDYPGKKPLHEGADFEPPAGSTCDPVVHIGADCTVTKVDEQSPVGYGKYIVVDFGNGFTAVYAHFAEVWVKVGQKLANRQIVGLMGATGSASEAHCHITLSNPSIGLDGYVYPKVVDPETYLVN